MKFEIKDNKYIVEITKKYEMMSAEEYEQTKEIMESIKRDMLARLKTGQKTLEGTYDFPLPEIEFHGDTDDFFIFNYKCLLDCLAFDVMSAHVTNLLLQGYSITQAEADEIVSAEREATYNKMRIDELRNQAQKAANKNK